jgi:putative addiction module CopG family antidote
MAKRTRTSKQATMNISMPPALRKAVEEQMRRGGFDNASEYVRHLIREKEQDFAPEWLEDMIEEGLKGPFEVADDKWLAARRAKLEAAIRAQARQRRKSA